MSLFEFYYLAFVVGSFTAFGLVLAFGCFYARERRPAKRAEPVQVKAPSIASAQPVLR